MDLRNMLLLGAFCLVANQTMAGQTVTSGPNLTPSITPSARPSLTPQAVSSLKSSVTTASVDPATGASSATEALPAGPHPLNKADADAWLDGYMPYALNTGDIPGAVVVVVKDGKILTARGFGYADRDKRTPVDPERTLFRPGSVSKLITWTAVMQLVEQKKLDLDVDVNTYLDFKIPAYAGAPITLRQIMTHTAGFEEAGKNLITYDPSLSRKLGDILKAWIPERIHVAGTTPAYSNYATALAGYIVERVSGEPFDDYVEHHIFTPLGMQHASFRQPLPSTLLTHMATGYSKPGGASAGFEIVGPAPAGAMSASGTDMGRFMIANLQQGELDGKRVFSADTAAAMHDSPLGPISPLSLVPPLNRMELGFFETNINGREVIGHLGDLEAFHTSLHLFMKEGVGFYVSFNSGGKGGAAGTLRGALFQDFADRYFPDTAAKDGRVDPKLAAEHARMMVGNWQNSRRSESSFFSVLGLFGQAKIEVNAKGELVIPALVGRNGRPREWVEIAPYVWRDRNGHDRLAAKLVDGQVVRWSMDFMSPFMVFDRVPAGKSSAWLTPALYTSLAVLLLTFLAWPIGWISRRKYKVSSTLAGTARQTSLVTQIASGLSLLVLAGWVAAFAAMLTSNKYASSAMDPWLWLLQLLGVIVFLGAIVISGRNLQLTWTDGRGRLPKLWSVLVFAATLLLFYIALRFGLVAFSVNY